MDVIHEPGVREVVIIKSSQLGYTEALNNIVAFFIDQEPSPMMVMQPTLEMGEAWSKDRFSTMVRDNERLREKVADAKAKTGGSTILHKTFPGGHLTIVGANSPASLASRPIRVLLCDEVDRYPPSAGAEGDPISLAKKRTTTFKNRVIVMGGTPTIKGESRIEAGFNLSDQRYYFLPCPHCGERQRLEWSQVKWQKDDAGRHMPETAVYVCKFCGAEIEEHHKEWMLAQRELRATKEFNGIAGISISTLYSPWVTWAQMARSFLEARQDPQTYKTWVNTELGETWEEKGQSVDGAGLLARRLPITPDSLPAGVVKVTLGVDTQDDRLELQFVAWGAGEESFVIEHGVIRGDPGAKPIWSELTEQRKRRFITEDGRTLLVSATGVDSGGHYSQQVYDYCHKHRFEHCFALKGAGGQGRLIWPKKPGKTKLSRADVYSIGVDTVKDLLYGRLSKIRSPGRGYINLSASLDQEWCDQFTSEHKVNKVTNGRRVSVWRPKQPGIRQEAQDCYIYAYAVLIGLRVDLDKLAAAIARKYSKSSAATPVADDESTVGKSTDDSATVEETTVDSATVAQSTKAAEVADVSPVAEPPPAAPAPKPRRPVAPARPSWINRRNGSWFKR